MQSIVLSIGGRRRREDGRTLRLGCQNSTEFRRALGRPFKLNQFIKCSFKIQIPDWWVGIEEDEGKEERWEIYCWYLHVERLHLQIVMSFGQQMSYNVSAGVTA